MELIDIADLVKMLSLASLHKRPMMKNVVLSRYVPGGASLTRKNIDEYTQFVSIYGAKGLAWMKVNEKAKGIEGVQKPLLLNS